MLQHTISHLMVYLYFAMYYSVDNMGNAHRIIHNIDGQLWIYVTDIRSQL